MSDPAEKIAGVVGIIFLGAILYSAVPQIWPYGEREGVVKAEDCREIILLKADTFQKYYKNFTCSPNGICVHIDTDRSLLSKGNNCLTAFVYDKATRKEKTLVYDPETGKFKDKRPPLSSFENKPKNDPLGLFAENKLTEIETDPLGFLERNPAVKERLLEQWRAQK